MSPTPWSSTRSAPTCRCPARWTPPCASRWPCPIPVSRRALPKRERGALATQGVHLARHLDGGGRRARNGGGACARHARLVRRLGEVVLPGDRHDLGGDAPPPPNRCARDPSVRGEGVAARGPRAAWRSAALEQVQGHELADCAGDRGGAGATTERAPCSAETAAPRGRPVSFRNEPEPKSFAASPEPNPWRSRGSLGAPIRMLHHDTLPMPEREGPRCADCGRAISGAGTTGRCRSCAFQALPVWQQRSIMRGGRA